jgi:hypothetical protein
MKLAKTTALCSQVIDRGRFVQATRPDGLEVFFDKTDDALSRWLNSIRAAADRRSVILAVGGDSEDQATVRLQIDNLTNNKLPSPLEKV